MPIAKIWDNFVAGLRWVIEAGKSISFWYDIGPHAQCCSMHCRDLASMWIKRRRQSHMGHMGNEVRFSISDATIFFECN